MRSKKLGLTAFELQDFVYYLFSTFLLRDFIKIERNHVKRKIHKV